MKSYEENNEDFENPEDLEENSIFGEKINLEALQENYNKNNKAIKKEKQKLTKILSKIDDNLLKICDSLIENIAFMSVTLDGLVETMKAKGIKEFYKNGKNQFGYKESVEVRVYNTMQKNYQSSIKVLIDMLTRGDSSGDEVEKLKEYFARGRK